MNTKGIILAVISFILFASLAPTALSLIEGYTPTDSILSIVWPLSAVLFLVGVALSYFDIGEDGLK